MKRYAQDKNRRHWSSIAQRADSAGIQQHSPVGHRDEQSSDIAQIGRRNFLKLMGASLALAGVAGCRRPEEAIVPYVDQPEEIVPGVPNYYATTIPFDTSAYGVIVECHEGRPTKIEGNPAHPSTRGASSIFLQAAILGLYDPNRSAKIRQGGKNREFADFLSFWGEQAAAFAADGGAGLAVLAEPFSSPTLARLKSEFSQAYPRARWVTYAPLSDETRTTALKSLTGAELVPVYRYDRARVILALDADFLQHESESITAAMDFAAGRQPGDAGAAMNRLYVVESAYSTTGGMADHRLRLPSEDIGSFLLALLRELADRGLALENVPSGIGNTEFNKKWTAAVASDLLEAGQAGLIVAGRRQPPWVHELVFLLNHALGSAGQCIDFFPLNDAALSSTAELNKLTTDMAAGQINTLFILGGNPVYNAPVDFNFAEALDHVAHTIHLGHYHDETAQRSAWHISQAHVLENWGDARAVDGTLSVVQPTIASLYGGYSDIELIGALVTAGPAKGYDLVRTTWQSIIGPNDFEKKWRRVLHDGVFEGTVSEEITFTPLKSADRIIAELSPPGRDVSQENLELGFYASNVFDGQFANNAWLQELPDPITKLTWDNASLLAPLTAEKLGVANGDMVELHLDDRSLALPVWIVPGLAEYCVALPLGYGRRELGRVADGAGFDTYLLRTSGGMSYVRGATMTRTGRTVELANVQDHNTMEGRPIIREATLSEYQARPEFAREAVEHPPLKSIYPDYDYGKGFQWGMVIDLNVCNGCNACVVACQSENNIPVVGKEQVAKGREMAWIRTDRYFAGSLEEPRLVFQPVACQQCENAPCEQVCPVAATVHDKEGLNTMNYNRCIGTRYCSNNCPYKVRRFNFFNYTAEMAEVVKMAQNPDVTVRSRGVMEKCTFCLQRINRAKREARKRGQELNDGDIQTACQQACPSRAISFGNLNDPASRVARLKAADRNYELLAELNVRPRISYRAKISNPHPQLAADEPTGGRHPASETGQG
jgi:molybdopterin-containing oxidoreductase family iron-sulfur binding subunit